MGASDHEHDGDPYTSLPGEHQIPYSPRHRSVRTSGDADPSDRDVPAPRGRRRRLRPALLAAVAVMAVAGAGAAAVGLGVSPDGSTVTTGSELEDTPSEETEATETPEATDDVPTPDATEDETDSASPESTEPESPSSTESVDDEPSSTPVPRAELSIGDCVDFEDGDLLAVDCEDLHEYELFAVPPSVSGADYPGATLVAQDARLKCQREFSNFKDAYAGSMSLKLAYQQPNQRQWILGEPVLCFVRNADGAYLEGSATDDAPDFF
jgi:hypothetical protein